MPGCSFILRDSSTRRFAADDKDMPGLATSNADSLSATAVSSHE
jgi:hypothetical protein